ncbi:hypothetical protein [Streptomyces spectabilis]|uniref:Uncharacterized protein n=1 Tax=Streptomyces spectabilis TaxID=68270 RepID=A0A5P2XG78_STRST|nr:hypothetical protein [Streptomyces spectabilis]MBB5102259.1 hypothetical protein [Streptomyces spectabilis]MCI3907307.1 hypothetical protein [Streptomyces spectabilis]QEV64037.1 hypothetical protein CP982_39515 [Streptomyces spectabilis]GGV29765.1 hypothetical protein GCM10010245_48330 [Streptomyces spectabilis]
MSVPTRMPVRPRRRRTPWRRRIAALVRGSLLAVMGLCALVHGPLDENHGPERPPVAVAVPTTEDAAPHSPHRHHGSEECAPDGPLRTPVAPAADQPPTGAGVLTAAAAFAVLRGPKPRRTQRRRRTRTGRTALVRTARWRI